jgi:hypothetical protein
MDLVLQLKVQWSTIWAGKLHSLYGTAFQSWWKSASTCCIKQDVIRFSTSELAERDSKIVRFTKFLIKSEMTLRWYPIARSFIRVLCLFPFWFYFSFGYRERVVLNILHARCFWSTLGRVAIQQVTITQMSMECCSFMFLFLTLLCYNLFPQIHCHTHSPLRRSFNLSLYTLLAVPLARTQGPNAI